MNTRPSTSSQLQPGDGVGFLFSFGERQLELGRGVYIDDINEPGGMILSTEAQYIGQDPPARAGEIEVRLARTQEELYLATHQTLDTKAFTVGKVYEGFLNVRHDGQEWRRTNSVGVVIRIYAPETTRYLKKYVPQDPKLLKNDPASFVAANGTHFVSKQFTARAAYVAMQLDELDTLTYDKLTVNSGAKGTWYGVTGDGSSTVRREIARAAREDRLTLHLNFLGTGVDTDKLALSLRRLLTLTDIKGPPLGGVDQAIHGRIAASNSTAIVDAVVEVALRAIGKPVIDGYELTSLRHIEVPTSFLERWSLRKREMYTELLMEHAKAEDKHDSINQIVNKNDPRYYLLSKVQLGELARPEVKAEFQRYADEITKRRKACFKSTDNFERSCGLGDFKRPRYDLVPDRAMRPHVDYIVQANGHELNEFESTRMVAATALNVDPMLVALPVNDMISAISKQVTSDSFTIHAQVSGRYLDRWAFQLVGEGAGLWLGDSNEGQESRFTVSVPKRLDYQRLDNQNEARILLLTVEGGKLSRERSPFLQFVQDQRDQIVSRKEAEYFYGMYSGSSVRIAVLDRTSLEPWQVNISSVHWFLHKSGGNWIRNQGAVALIAPVTLRSSGSVAAMSEPAQTLSNNALQVASCSATVFFARNLGTASNLKLEFGVDADCEKSTGSFFYDVQLLDASGRHVIRRFGRLGWHASNGKSFSLTDDIRLGDGETFESAEVIEETIICVPQ